MSTPSFQLSKDAKGIWWATADVGQKKPVRVNCGDGSKKSAEEIARREVKRRHQLAEAGKIRWRKFYADKAAGKRAPAADSSPTTSRDAEGVEPPSTPAPADGPAEEVNQPPAPERAAEIASKLRTLGDGRPIVPDHVEPPSSGPRPTVDDDDPPLDEEAGELLAEIFAAALVAGHLKLVKKWLAKRRPPKRPGEPNERMQQWEHDGLGYNLGRILGPRTQLGLTGKMLIGAGFMTLGMLIDAEPIDGAPAQPAASSPPAPPPPAPSASAADDTQPGERPAEKNGAVGQNALALGRF